ncbi:hypothetical protein [Rubrivirga litoralis]|uniref:Asparagine synthase (Glutamine-hydrolysing) n=1 Tax=Rubrivirga litoralis TaxID=3075598 RepID=A0ABU3BSK1_9BACT|nr:hypothetical protein [Rubrivirga sp. F394]MDT0632210.1 hypothetical protein [Rubrivirga sp. F394]
MHPLLYRRQFLLGPRPVDGLPDAWQRIEVAGGRILHAHPDLAVTQRERGGVELTLLGYAIDPHHPERDDADVLDDLLGRVGRAAEVLAETDPLGGRWALVATDADEALLFHDAHGLRQVVYTHGEGGVWCASDTPLLGHAVELEDDPEAVAEFVESDHFQRWPQVWWPGDRTRYAGVRQLLPNHVLDLGTGAPRRFWPTAPLEPRTLKSGVERGTAILRGMVAGATRRFPLTAAVTAGVDSRLLLAACRGVTDRVAFYTFVHYEIDRTHVDVVTPAEVLGSLGLDHHVVDCLSVNDFLTSDDPAIASYRSLYMSNTSVPHDVWGAISYSMNEAVPGDRVLVKSNCNSTTWWLHPWRDPEPYRTPEELARAMARRMTKGNPFAIREFTDWATRAARSSRGYDLLNLFHVEQRVGRWQAADQLERDLDHETFDAANSREYYSTLLGVPAKHRKPPYRLHREMIRAMWPGTLSVPINPLPLRKRAWKAVRPLFVATGTLGPLKRLVRGS